ncbi:exo-alpha-sialidase [Phragmitibacter flavus]|uniref:exo-alpha-sialidase n=1 Tax=Phragmitibacter flavus TaxID=2576071 RepID=A0A5R8KAQ5_9BACT|nr:sialidase family protein [Phragmitibacter flavus]TLD69392.1 exo-alpha-sialidase [Phragmitibacter flavus]
MRFGLTLFVVVGLAGGLLAVEDEPFLEVLPEPVMRGMIHLPGLLVTEADTVLLIAQSRIKKGDWDPADVVISRSLDQGRTWTEPFKLFASDGSSNLGYSCMLVEDRRTTPHTVFAYYTTGPVPWESHQLIWYGRRSVDEGDTWSEPFLVKNDGDAESKPSNGGHGFQFANGRMVIPGRKSFLTSDDGGISWRTHRAVDSVETKVAPLSSTEGTGADSIYSIGRKTLEYQIFGSYGDKHLETGKHGNPFTTMGRNPGLVSYPSSDTKSSSLLLMSGIIEKEGKAFCITSSSDQGRTWSARRMIDDQGWYSDLGVTKDGTIIAAYTVGFSADLKIARFNLPWVTSR